MALKNRQKAEKEYKKAIAAEKEAEREYKRALAAEKAAQKKAEKKAEQEKQRQAKEAQRKAIAADRKAKAAQRQAEEAQRKAQEAERQAKRTKIADEKKAKRAVKPKKAVKTKKVARVAKPKQISEPKPVFAATEKPKKTKRLQKSETEPTIIKKHGQADKPYTKQQEKEQEKKRKEFKDREKQLAKVTKLHSKEILEGKIVSIANNIPSVQENIIELFDVKKSYLTGDLEYEVLKGIDLKIKKGTFVVILGPSGSGKTTLLNIISGLDKANQGDVFVSGYNLSLLKDSHLTKFRRDNVGFIFQQYNLLTNLTARENAEVGENLAKTKNKALGIDEIFKVIEMDEHMNKFPSQLSGGQQQRVSIGRALAKNPKILFCDEPTGALDEEMGRKVLEILLDVNKAFKTSIIMVTHNPNFQYVADIVINVKNGGITSVKHNPSPKKPSEINWG